MDRYFTRNILAKPVESLRCSLKLINGWECNQCNGFHPKKYQTCWRNVIFLNEKLIEVISSLYGVKTKKTRHFLWNLHNIEPTCTTFGPAIALCLFVINKEPCWCTFLPKILQQPLSQTLLLWPQVFHSIPF